MYDVVLRSERDVLWRDLKEKRIASKNDEHESETGEDEALRRRASPANAKKLDKQAAWWVYRAQDDDVAL